LRSGTSESNFPGIFPHVSHDALVLAIGGALGAAMVLGWIFVRSASDRAARTARAELLHRADDLQTQVAARTADLHDSNARLRSIINSAVDGIVVIDARGHVESFNPGAERLFGYAEAEVIGRNVSMLMPSPYREEHDRYIERYQETGTAKIIGIGREVRGRRKDGSTFPLHLSVGEMTVGSERQFTGILHDLSTRVQMEERLREQAALARLGEMAAVIAHEVKNPLAGVRGAIQVLGGRLPASSTDATIVSDILARIDSLNQLMQDLLLFARPPQPRRAPVEIVPLLASTADHLARDPALGMVRVEIGGSAPPISADAEMLRIVFHNLLVNAAHAMGGTGCIRVAVTSVDALCHVTVTDSGPGIPVELREQVFVPFFTTKSRGSGLGLPTAKRLVDAHGGQMTFDSPPEGGLSVNVRLPEQTGTP
jgi:two-component system sensor kinase FixL